jgi:hypothetical protein
MLILFLILMRKEISINIDNSMDFKLAEVILGEV